MDPQIRYCLAEDGVSVAYWTLGQGPMLVMCPPGPVGHIAGELLVEDIRATYERLSRSFTILRFDTRGAGSSPRELETTHATRVLDLRAALAASSQRPAALWAGSMWVAPALEVAATNPELVSHLVVWQGYARREDFQPSSRLVATRALASLDWSAYTDAWAQTGLGWRRPDSAREWSRWLRSAMTPESAIAMFAMVGTADVTPHLSAIRAPTLVVDYERPNGTSPAAARTIASGIPDARLVMLSGQGLPFHMDIENMDRKIALIEEFLGVSPPAAMEPEPPPTDPAPAGTAIILFVDIAGSTALTERIGDAAFRARARDLDAALRDVVRQHGGQTIDAKTLGDGILATFRAASQAIAAALGCGAAGDARALPLHLGIHAGDVIREADNVFGGAVNIAARISALSAPSELLVSRTVADLARTSALATFHDRGEHALKGIAEPVHLYAVQPVE